jgi:uncharacterized RDD family membrane protein YckC
MTTRNAEEYLREVMDRIPRALPGRSRMESDLRLHLADLLADDPTGVSPEERMGPAEQVAAEFLAQFPIRPCGHGRRLAAFVLDLLIILIPYVPLAALAIRWQDGHPALPLLIALSLLIGALTLVYFPLLEAVWGQTLGKRLMGICVVGEDGSRAGWGAVLIRRIPFIGNFFPIDALFVFFTARRQRAFDKVAGTLVVDCR